MKAIMMSIRPEWVAKILNGEKTIEIRKKFPKDYVGWVYIYCTKDKSLVKVGGRYLHIKNNFAKKFSEYQNMSGKVVARFWCDKVEEIKSCQVPFTFDQTIRDFYTDTFNDMDDLLKASCIDYYSLEQYLKYSKKGCAIHITKLEIFDKPKELAQHTHDNNSTFYTRRWDKTFKCWRIGALIRAPQSWQFVEVDL